MQAPKAPTWPHEKRWATCSTAVFSAFFKGNIGRANGLSKKQKRVFAANPHDRYNLSNDNSIVTIEPITTANDQVPRGIDLHASHHSSGKAIPALLTCRGKLRLPTHASALDAGGILYQRSSPRRRARQRPAQHAQNLQTVATCPTTAVRATGYNPQC